MSDEEICKMLGWPKRATEVLAADSEGLLPRIRAVVREAERREREACAKVCEETTAAWTQYLYNSGCVDCAAAIRARNNK